MLHSVPHVAFVCNNISRERTGKKAKCFLNTYGVHKSNSECTYRLWNWYHRKRKLQSEQLNGSLKSTLPPCNDSNTKETGQFNLFYLMQFITRLYLGNRLVTSKGSQGTTNYHRCYLVVQNGRLQDARIARTFRGYPWFDMIILLSFPAKNIYIDGNRVNEWPLVKSNHHRA